MLYNWCRKNSLAINIQKTKAMFFSSKYLNSTSKPFRKLKLDNRNLDFVDDYNYLGVVINCKLSFKKHLNNIIKTVSYKSSKLSKIRPCLTTETSSLLYKSMILYGDVFFHNSNNKLFKKLEAIQNRCVRLISKLA